MITFTEILTCEGTALYEITKKDVSFKTSGQMQVLIAYDGMILLKLNDFQYGVNPKDEIIYDQKDPQFAIILSLKKYPEGQWMLKINEHADEVFSCLNQKCYLKSKHGKQRSSYTSKEAKQEEPVKVEKKKKNYEVQLDEEEEKEKQQLTASSVLVGASKGIGIGLAFTGKLLSKGISSVGGLISKAVTPAQKVEVSENTKANLETAKKTSKNVLNFTAKQVGNLFQYGKNKAAELGEKIQKTETGKNIQEHQYYDNVKQGTKTGVKVFSNLYDGVVTAVYEIGSGIGKGTSKVVGAKYGEEAGQAADDAFEGAGNIMKIARIPQDQAAKTFKQ